MSTCSVMRWPSTRWRTAASTSAPPAGRSTLRLTRETPGSRSSVTCLPCSRSRCRPYRERALVCRRAGDTVIRVVLPAHLRTLARVDGEVHLEVAGPATQCSVLDALEARYPMLRGTIRDQRSG